MPITALPPATAQAIGSTSVISSPCSIIKELLDNALDALATSIAIEISQNTIDVIQVRDNGHGIAPEDHALVCKRAFTSKIQTVEDLRKVGGTSLGFRGEALASAAEVSGSLTVSTRVEAELVGVSVKYGRNGELLSSQRVSHPVGTSIRITDLFKHIPVRRQTTLKNSTKELLKIKRMIQAYVMARPYIRISFKVLKARSDSSNWMYAPGKDATLMDAALKIASTEIATDYIHKEWPPCLSVDTEGQGEGPSGFQISSLILSPESDFTKSNNASQYISIDGRPVSTSRGVARDIVKLYKSYLRSFQSNCGATTIKINDPFLCMHIQCPEASYDANIEPAKDDVLFEDTQALLILVESLLRDVYGSSDSDQGAQLPPSCDIGGASDTDELGPSPPRPTQDTPTPQPMSMMPGITRQDVVAVSHQRRDHPHSTLISRRSSLSRASDNTSSIPWIDLSRSNPSSTTRINPQYRRPNKASPQHAEPPCSPTHAPRQTLRQIIVNSGEIATPNIHRPGRSLPSPTSSSTSASPPDSASSPPSDIRPGPPHPRRSRMSQSTSLHNSSERSSRERDRERYGNGSLDTWFLKSSQATIAQTAGNQSLEDTPEHPLSQLTQQRFGSDQPLPGGLLAPLDQTTPTPAPPAPGQSESPDAPISPPTPDVSIRNKRRKLPVLDRWSASLHNLSKTSQTSDLERALDFETRKRAAIQERRNQLRSHQENSTGINSPHSNRYLAARAALAPDPANSQAEDGANTLVASKVALNPHDPRAYLMRHLETRNTAEAQGGTKLKRIITNKLPFEKIPQGCDLYDVGLRQPADLTLLFVSIKEALKTDLYARSGEQIDGFTWSNTNTVIERWTHRLSSLTNTHYQGIGEGSVPNLEFDFSALDRVSDASEE